MEKWDFTRFQFWDVSGEYLILHKAHGYVLEKKTPVAPFTNMV